jgi:hypothetical protein
MKKMVVKTLSSFVSTSVLNHSHGHWLFHDVLYFIISINLKFHENFGNQSIIVEGSLEDQIGGYIVLIGYPCGKYGKHVFKVVFYLYFLYKSMMQRRFIVNGNNEAWF